MARRFSRLAGICLLVVAASGSYNAWIELGAVSALWSTDYGRILALKLVVVLVLVAIGAENRFWIVPALLPGGRVRWFNGVRSQIGAASIAPELGFWQLVTREAALALIVFACTAVLVHVTPPRHRHHHVAESGHSALVEIRRTCRRSQMASLVAAEGPSAASSRTQGA